MNENPGQDLGVYYVSTLANALTIASPTLGSLKPVPLVATTKSGHAGYNLAIGLGNFGNTFKSSSNSYVWITESQSDIKNEYFASADDWPNQLAEPNVWVLGSVDSKGRIPISLTFVGPNQTVITCARFFDDSTFSDSPPTLGATCASIGLISEFDTTVVSFSRSVC